LWGAKVRDIKTGRRHVVNTEEHECTCLEWQHTGKPCDHAILFLASKSKLNMHPYLHEYYSAAKFKAAYATPIQPLTDQSQWPKGEIEFSLCPPLTKRKAGRPGVSRFKAWFEKGGSSKKAKKDEKPKRSQKGTKNRSKLCEELGHRVGSSICCYTPKRTKYVFLLLILFCCFFHLLYQMTCFLFQEKTFRSGPGSGAPRSAPCC
jgi:hypothetical protein